MVSRRQIIKANHQHHNYQAQQAISEDEEAAELWVSRPARVRSKKQSNDSRDQPETEFKASNKKTNQGADRTTNFDELKSRFDKLTRHHKTRDQAKQIESEDIDWRRNSTVATNNSVASIDRQHDNKQQDERGQFHHESLLDDALSFNQAHQQQEDQQQELYDTTQNSKLNKWPKRTTTTTTTTKTNDQQARSNRSCNKQKERHEMDRQELADRTTFESDDDENENDEHKYCHRNEHDDLYRNFDPYSIYGDEDEEENVWYSEEKLQMDHIQEIVNKWHSIDDEIWAKIICMERNRRIAKAYARQHTISINGSRDDYLDGTTLGLNSFDNPDRDSKTSYIKQYIGEGIEIKIHQNGDIFARRLSRSNVFVHKFKSTNANNRFGNLQPLPLKGSQSSSDVYALNSSEGGGYLGEFYGIVGPKQDKAKKRQALMADLDKRQQSTKGAGGFIVSSKDKTSGSSSGVSSQSPLPKSNTNNNGGLSIQLNKVVRLFSMSKFKQALEFESRKSLPNRARLQNMCISVVSFVMNDQKMLNLPSWIMIINIVAMDLLSSEIGLVEPYDLLPSIQAAGDTNGNHWIAASGDGQHNRLVRANRSFDCFDDQGYENDEDDDEDDGCNENGKQLYQMFNGGFSGNSRNKLVLQRNFKGNLETHQIDTGDKTTTTTTTKTTNGEFSMYNTKEYPTHLDKLNHKLAQCLLLNNTPKGNMARLKTPKQSASCFGPKGTSSDSELNNQTKSTTAINHHRLNHADDDDDDDDEDEGVHGPTNAIEQLGSSSSGFISSHQNDDSSANSSSSSSKIANSDRPIVAAAKMNLDAALKPSRFRQKLLLANKSKQAAKNAKVEQQQQQQQQQQQRVPTTASQVRAKRPPKLPHGISGGDTSLELGSLSSENETQVIMSGPIPIPAPPTSAGGPSGRANLILVSPTGLSPPTPKKLHANETQAARTPQSLYSSGEFLTKQCSDSNCNARSMVAPNESTKQARLKLPQGIPAHAQLAPPATRKHILRYLMSTGQPCPSNKQIRDDKQHQAPPVRRCVQRPLPGLPGLRHQQHQQQPPDEGLYYRGLQARVMQARAPHAHPQQQQQAQLQAHLQAHLQTHLMPHPIVHPQAHHQHQNNHHHQHHLTPAYVHHLLKKTVGRLRIAKKF